MALVVGLISCLVAGRAGGLNVASAHQTTLGSNCGDAPCDTRDPNVLDNNMRTIALGSAAQLQLLQPTKVNGEGGSTNDASPAEGISAATDDLQNGQYILKKPVGDHRQYQYFTLENGMEVVNINDRNTKTAAFAVAVTAGLYYDPPEHLGLAHLTEHSLFLGTESYPDTSGFDEFLAKNGGSSNAYTAEEVTVYYANLNAAGFEEGLDRFADFFRAPLLNETSIYPEVSAVVSEHSKNVQSPAWYCERVMLSTANPANPIQAFHTGDESTLQNLGATNISVEINTYFKNNYCPPRFKLVTFGSDSVYTQLRQANKSFGSIPKKGKNGVCSPTKQEFKLPEAFPKENLNKWLLVQGSTWASTLWMLFPLEDLSKWTKSHPMNYAEYMVGFAGKNSLSLVLRDQLDLATGISLSAEDSSAGTMVWITVELSPKGAQKPQAVMDVIFTYLQHAKKGCTPEALTSLAKSARLVWDWPNPEEASKAASSLAEGMTRLAPEELLAADDLMEEPNQTRVMQVLEKLRPEHMNVGLVRPDAEKVLKEDKFAKVETLPHYGVKYNVSVLDDWSSTWKNWGATENDTNMTQAYTKLAERLRGVHNMTFNGTIAMQLPPSIDGIPENMSLCHAQADQDDGQLSHLWGAQPQSLLGTKSNELWFRKGWMSPQPFVEASTTLRTRSLKINETVSANDIVLLQVGMHLLADELNQRLADVGYKGFYFSVSQTHMGVYVWLSGFTPNLLNMTDRMLKEMNSALDEVDHASLNRVVSGLRTDFTDNSGEAIKTAMMDQKVLLTPRMHSKSELVKAITNGTDITWAKAKKAVEDARHGPFYATSLVMGNYAEDDAKTLHKRLLDGLGAETNVTADQIEKVTPVVMPARPVELRKANPRDGDKNHVTIVTILAGVATVENRVLLGLVGQIYSQVVFAELRTKMELGYVVGGSVSEMSTVLAIDCYVQGSKKLPDEVEAACEHVWGVTVPEEVKNLDDKTFASHREAFKSSLLEGPLTTNQELTHFEDPILLGGCLDLRSSMIAFLDTVKSKDQLLEAWNNVILPGGDNATARKKVVVKYFGGGMAIPAAPTDNETETLFKNAGVNGSALERVKKEHKAVQVVNEANSDIRAGIAKEGGYFPAELHCSWPASSNKTQADPSPAPAPAGDADDSFNVLVHGELAPHGAATAAAGHGMKALMRSEMGLKTISLHRGGDSEPEAGQAHRKDTPSALSGASHRRRLMARRVSLQPRPSRPVAHFEDVFGERSASQRNLPGLHTHGRERLRRLPWDSKVDFELAGLSAATAHSPSAHFH